MTADSIDIRFECHQCGQHLVMEAAGAGLTTDCPICNTTVTVPTKPSGKGGDKPLRVGVSTAEPPAAPRSPYADLTPDEQREELIDASLINGKLLGDLTKAREEIGRLQQQAKSRGEDYEHLHASTTHAQAELKTFQSERAQLKAEATALRQRLTTAEEALATREGELKEAQAKAIAAEKAHKKAERYGDDWRGKAQAADTAFAEAKEQAAARETVIAAVEAALRETRESVASLETKSASLQDALAAEHAHRDQLSAELAERRRELADIHARITERKNELHAARNRVTELEALLSTTRQTGERLETESATLRQQLEAARLEVANAGDLQARLAATAAELEDHRQKLRHSEESGEALGQRCEELRRECDSLRRDLTESHAGRELLEVRAQLESIAADRERAGERIATLERDLRAFTEKETGLRAELESISLARDEAAQLAKTLSDAKTVKDNEVLRGIVARLNAEIAQRTAEVHRLRRARLGLKIAYVVFGIGLLAVIALALVILPHALRH